jgi:hypothetical protein
MNKAHETGIWRRSLGVECSPEEAETFRLRLITALELFRDRAKVLAGEISRDLPDFTVHDETHFDALWDLADRLAGPSLTLTPVEAFVFGGAALIHDLGMASAAYAGEGGSIEDDPRWPDMVMFVLREELGRAPKPEEIASPDEAVVRSATAQLLRELHAKRAEVLATTTWQGSKGEQFALLEDGLLRSTYGPMIGRIAHSHWWAPSQVGESFDKRLGAPAGCPAAWTARPIVVACLLRLADASHLDATRAPRFLKALRKPSPDAARHWDFQARLSQPYAEDDRFVFTSPPFAVDEAAAWWLCADTLAAVDGEFRAVDALLADHDEDRFAIRGVAGASDPSQLATYIPTEGWTPADARIRISDVVRLVKRMGGNELYGKKPHVPLRELVQNAADAVRARRSIEPQRGPDWGEIVVRMGEVEDDRRWLEVEDTGVGMSSRVLTEHLLDFGRSFWESERVLEELPGLLARGFEPTGQFGIGFFSAFMWGDEVTVTSRRYDAGTADTQVLEFSGGLSRRPLLRPAATHERMVDPGTRVRVLLNAEALWRLGIDQDVPVVPTLVQLCAWLAPALDVTVSVEALGEDRAQAVTAGDWIQMPMDELAERISHFPIRLHDPGAVEEEEGEDEDGEENPPPEESPEQPRLGKHARVLKALDGKVVGRAVLNPTGFQAGIVAIGGFRSSVLRGISGVFLGDPTTAARNIGIPAVPPQVLAEWATEQAILLGPELSGEAAFEAAGVVQLCGGETGSLPIVSTREGPLSMKQAEAWVSDLQEVVVIHDAGLSNDIRTHGTIELSENVAAVSMIASGLLFWDSAAGGMELLEQDWPRSNDVQSGLIFPARDSLFGALREALERVWGGPYVGSHFSEREEGTPVIGTRNGADVHLEAYALRRPGT